VTFAPTRQQIVAAGQRIADELRACDLVGGNDHRWAGELRVMVIDRLFNDLKSAGCNSDDEALKWLDVVLKAARHAGDLDKLPPAGSA
jgi:hypothetical protein